MIKSRASTYKKLSSLPRYRHPADLVNINTKPIILQRLQIDGKLKFDKNLYISSTHQHLMKQLKMLRKNYNHEQNKQNIIKMSMKEYMLWKQYLQSLVKAIPSAQSINQQQKSKIYQCYLIAKQRNHQKIQLSRTVKLLSQLGIGFKFDIAFHPLIMIKLIHPHFGYLNSFTTHRLIFDDYITLLSSILAISNQFYQGNILHGNQLLSFLFWNICFQSGHIQLTQFCQFLSYFKFNVPNDNFCLMFQYHLNNRKLEFYQNFGINFDLWRKIYLQRGL